MHAFNLTRKPSGDWYSSRHSCQKRCASASRRCADGVGHTSGSDSAAINLGTPERCRQLVRDSSRLDGISMTGKTRHRLDRPTTIGRHHHLDRPHRPHPHRRPSHLSHRPHHSPTDCRSERQSARASRLELLRELRSCCGDGRAGHVERGLVGLPRPDVVEVDAARTVVSPLRHGRRRGGTDSAPCRPGSRRGRREQVGAVRPVDDGAQRERRRSVRAADRLATWCCMQCGNVVPIPTMKLTPHALRRSTQPRSRAASASKPVVAADLRVPTLGRDESERVRVDVELGVVHTGCERVVARAVAAHRAVGGAGRRSELRRVDRQSCAEPIARARSACASALVSYRLKVSPVS